MYIPITYTLRNHNSYLLINLIKNEYNITIVPKMSWQIELRPDKFQPKDDAYPSYAVCKIKTSFTNSSYFSIIC